MALAGLALAAWLAAAPPGCGPTTGQAPGDPDAIVLLGGRVFAGGDRCARLLDEIAATTGVFGRLHFDLIARPGAGPAGLAEALRAHGPAAAVIAIVGDLALLPGVDPSRPVRNDRSLIIRDVDTRALHDGLERLRAVCRDLGTELVLATGPLGRQGRIEVRELLQVADVVREQAPVLDLQARFQALEPAPLFANGVDVLDDFGHDALVRNLLEAVLARPELLPPRTDDARAARRAVATLGAWLEAPDGGDREALRALLQEPPDGPVAAARQAAVATLLHGLDAEARQRWAALDGTSGDIPGLAVARVLCGLPVGDLTPGDPVEAGALPVLEALAGGDPSATGRAQALVDAHPERIEAWIVLALASWTGGQETVVRRDALRTLRRLGGPPLAPRHAVELLGRWPATLEALPALLVASRPWADLLPGGPALERARRQERLGLLGAALQTLDRAAQRGRMPPAWEAERQALAKALMR